MKLPCVYIMTNRKNGTLYIGVTSCLQKRVFEHKNGLVAGFTKRYHCKILVFYEQHEIMESAILREKQLKSSSRKHKIALIENTNSLWSDLYNDII